MRGASEYIQLSSSPEGFSDAGFEEAEKPEQSVRDHSNGHNGLIFWACIGALLSTTLSVILFARDLYLGTGQVPFQTTTGQALRRPSQYMNLDKILANSTHEFPPINNFPPVTFQINVGDSRRKMKEDERGRPTKLGAVYPDDRRILINSKFATIVQFRNIDYAMERCVLNITMPQKTDTFDPAVTLLDPSLVDIWTLDTPNELSRYIDGATTYAPKRKELLTTLTFSETSPNTFGEFHCPSGQFTTLELTCSPLMANCNVDFWQDRRARPLGGLHIIQHSSTVSPV
ncbi:hypothetical protein QCA50_008591 [Cerrena zonata]|uniref:Ubiquitin 3 binding protein But2 C-terminal domain-containing protein n=1 Tax=Cerrena zonata TaxID=2478898 RepID=A0AAW0G4H6_9APHY